MEKLKRDHFKLEIDENGIEYLVQAKDELTKNHRTLEHREQCGYMPENRTDRLCPIVSYKKYISHLNPANEYLWQTPLQRVDETISKVWYSKGHLGKNPLSKFMTELSEKCHLSMIYKNHSIRATGCTVTGRKHGAKVTMNWSGHKSVQSLAGYQKVSHEEKMGVAKTLENALRNKQVLAVNAPEELQALPSTSTVPAIQAPTVQAPIAPPPPNPPVDNEKALVPLEANLDDNSLDDFDFDLYDLIQQAEKDSTKKVAAVNNSVVKNTNQPKSNMFSNCKIGTINLQIHNHYK